MQLLKVRVTAMLVAAAAIWCPVLAAQDVVPSEPSFGAVVAEEALAAHRGGDQQATYYHVNEMTLDGVLSDNVAENLTTGDNVITQGAFSNVEGVPMVIQNTGNNVIIQNATILNLNLK